ncbi:transglycosylase SLT domain-containing protein [Clostridium senegalense]|uniref:Lytic transglycosylase domain-containing protein n=1 Tax=Clostridium senegalense TaxID=1465809 RepID=A0A6M0H8X1_9CLOT|nr:transglycosylase SLT domain-containing protein [Clostridium senegalense]NEU06042.1 lytic transglycosylase domain-containing protein [Clostridium senegalense]
MKKVTIVLLSLAVIVISSGLFVREMLFPITNIDVIKECGENYKVDPAVIAAVIHFETNFRETPYKKGRPSGLMNITDDSGMEIAKKAGIKIENKADVAKAENNIRLGSFYISENFNGKDFKEMMANWISRNGEVEEQDKSYAKKYYGDKIEKREKIYKFLYPSLK